MAQKNNVFCFTHPDHHPFFAYQKTDNPITIELTPFPQSQAPIYNFRDYKSPGATPLPPGTWTIEFVQFTANDKYKLSYDGLECGAYIFGNFVPYTLQYFGTTQQNVDEIKRALTKYHPLLKAEEVTVTFVSGTKYQIVLTGRNNDRDLAATIQTSAQSNADINVVRVTTGIPPSEPAWSYPFTVLHNAVYYRCILPHTSTAGAGGNEPGVGATWTTYWVNAGLAAPPWESWQASPVWAAGKVYSPQDRGFPAAVTFYQQRTIFGGSKDAGTTIWGSAINDYDYFGTGVNPNDAFTFDLDDEDNPGIRWIRGQRGLIVGTSSGDYGVNEDFTPITPTNILARRHNSRRSANVPPAMLDRFIFALSQGRRSIDTMAYNDTAQSFESADALFQAEHMGGVGIDRIIDLKVPFNMVWALRKDGTLIGMTFDPANDVLAWQRRVTDGTFKEIGTGHTFYDGIGSDDVWVVTLRNGAHRIERMTLPEGRLGSDTQNNGEFTYEPTTFLSWVDSIHLDSYVHKVEAGATSTLTGLTHLAGKTVSVVADQKWFGEFVVSGGGTVSLPSSVTEWVAGLPFTGRLRTFERVKGDKGLALGTMRRWSILYARLVESAFPAINGQLPPDRSPSVGMDLSQFFTTGDVRLHQIGYDDGSIEFTQEYPFNTQILGFYGEFAANARN
jgi:hypothetical protein